MADEPHTLQRIAWAETFPFVRLFSTFRRAVSFWPMALAFVCVVLSCTAGWVLDCVWVAADGGVLVVSSGPEALSTPARRALLERGVMAGGRGHGATMDEIEAFATLDGAGFENWRNGAVAYREQLIKSTSEADAQAYETEKTELLTLIDERLATCLTQVEGDESRSAADMEVTLAELRRAADVLRLTVQGQDTSFFGPATQSAKASGTLFQRYGDASDNEWVEQQSRVSTFLMKYRNQGELERLAPRGPFCSLLKYEMSCFAGAVQGVCNGRLGFSGDAFSGEPAMLGSIGSAARGIWWLVTERRCLTVFLAVLQLLIFALFGGAICRISAVESARDERISATAALQFVREKYTGFIAAPLLPIGIFLATAVVMWVGGLIGAIPGLQIVIGFLYGLTLLGGIVLVSTFIALIAGFHLMWPTIATEGSDAFDAVQRAAGYLFQRTWNVAFYSISLLVYGAFSFVIVRMLAMLLFKLTHMATGAGMNVVSSGAADSVGKLDAMWHMPAWADLPWLPTVDQIAFWGSFETVPLTGAEWLARWFFAAWVMIFVAMVGAFVISFYFCGSTQMYLLLRRDVDAVDYDEVYYEEPEDEFAAEPAPAEAADAADGDNAETGGDAKDAD